jgi:UDP-glucose:glycoprotein glucosyltransferase
MTPRGVQLVLGTQTEPHVVDTIVMSNLGYFQLKAAPRAWTLRLATGRSQELYSVVGATDAGATATDAESVVVIDSLQGERCHRLQTHKP